VGRPANALLYHTRLQCLWTVPLSCHVPLVIWLRVRVVNRSITLGPWTPGNPWNLLFGSCLQWRDSMQHVVASWCIRVSNIPSLPFTFTKLGAFRSYLLWSLASSHQALRRISAVLQRSFDLLPPSQPKVWWHGACWGDRSSGKGSKNDRQLRQGQRLSQAQKYYMG
jgi:hypothetical protein